MSKDKNSFIIDEEHKRLFKYVSFMVEANSFEHHQLWHKYHYAPSPNSPFVEKWEQHNPGHMITVGHINDRPIVVSIFYEFLNHKKLMFYYGCSQLVDHKMIEDWLKYHTEATHRYDNNSRWSHCDAQNFHHCFDIIKVRK